MTPTTCYACGGALAHIGTYLQCINATCYVSGINQVRAKCMACKDPLKLGDPAPLCAKCFLQGTKVEQTLEAMQEAAGSKYDDGKPPLALLSTTWLKGVAAVLGFGANKYEADNWRKGLERRRLLSAALRHIVAYNDGEDLDPESGLNHLDHAACCLMFARELHDTRPDLDDRYKGKKP